MARRNADIPEDHRIVLRIGINIGDVIVDGDDLYGDGINVAARLEEMAEPGGICVSRSVRDQIRDKLLYDLEDLGERELKNIARPVRVFRVSIEESGNAGAVRNARPPARPPQAAPPPPQPAKSNRLWPGVAATAVVVVVVGIAAWQGDWLVGTTQTAAVPDDAAEQPKALPLPDRPSIAVLAFDNLSGDPDQEFFSDAMSESIITNLASIRELFVIARNSSFTYKGKPVSLRQVSEELGVRYVLEGSVQRQDDRVRIIAQLIDARADEHLWQQTYDRDASDIFALQDEIAQKVAQNISYRVRLRTPKGTRNVEAFELVYRAKILMLRINKEDNDQALAYALRAIELDPEYGGAHGVLGAIRRWRALTGWGDTSDDTNERALELLNKAIELDETDYYSRYLRGWLLSQMGRFEEAMGDFQIARTLNPNNPDVLSMIGLTDDKMGNHEAAARSIQAAMRANPFYPFFYANFLGRANYSMRNYEEAVERFTEAARINPTNHLHFVWMAAAYAQLGRQEEAETAAAAGLEKNPQFTVSRYVANQSYSDPEDAEHLREGLRKGRSAGMTERHLLRYPPP